MIYLELIFNLSLLVSLTIVSGFIEKRYSRSTRVGVILQGLLFGGAAVLGMLRPMVFLPGLFFDGRSVMISLCALFFGPLAGVISGGMAAVCRLSQGGMGMATGLLVILSSLMIGLLARLRFKSAETLPTVGGLYLFGLAVHLAMLVMMFAVIGTSGIEVITRMGVPVMLLYPLATLLAGKILLDQVKALRAEAEIRNSEEMFRSTFEQHAAVKMIIDPETGAIVNANLAAERYYGWSKDQLLHMRIQDINTLSPGDIHREMESARSLKQVFFEFRHRRADGSIRDVEVFSSVIVVKGKNLLHSIVYDITDRKEVQRALKESEAKHRLLFETIAQGVVYQAADGSIISANPAAERILGLPLEQLMGKTSMDSGWKTIHEDGSEVPGQDHPVMVALRTGKPVGPVILGVFHSGKKEYSWLAISAIPLFKPGETVPYQAYASFDDITELRKAEQQYQLLFRQMLDGCALHQIICDGQGKPVDYRFLSVNPAFERMTTLKANDVIGKTVMEVLPATEPHWIETYGKVALTGEPVLFEQFSAPLGKLFEVTAFRPAPMQFACIFADITGRKRAEEEREKLQAKLNQAQKMESVGRLAGGVAHDFNNMLGVILGQVEIAMDDVAPSHPAHAALQEIQTAAERSVNLTRQLLAFARKQDITPQVLDLNVAIESTLKMLQRLIGEDIDLVWWPGNGQWYVKIDPSQLEQILANLCVNARDAIADVGKVAIQTEIAAFDEDYCAVNPGYLPGSYVMLSVTDNGCGMDNETLNQLFEPFFTTKEVGEGTGLGLATVYGIVRQNEGFIGVYSEPGEGTTFKIYLPRYAGQVARREEPSAPAAHGNETILLVEDEPAIMKLTRIMLQRLGYTVLGASSPEEAIRMASEYGGGIHLLLTDVVMPRMNGRCLAERLAVDDPKMKCLYMSGFTSDVIAHRGVIDAGLNFISKPFSSQQLAAKIRAILGA